MQCCDGALPWVCPPFSAGVPTVLSGWTCAGVLTIRRACVHREAHVLNRARLGCVCVCVQRGAGALERVRLPFRRRVCSAPGVLRIL